MTVDNELISVFITDTKLCYLCVAADEKVVKDSVTYVQYSRITRSALLLGWNANFTRNISVSHMVIVHSSALCEALQRLILQH